MAVKSIRKSLLDLIKTKVYETETTETEVNGEMKKFSKPLENDGFKFGNYSDEDVSNTIKLLQEYEKGNKEYNKNKDANEKIDKYSEKLSEEEQKLLLKRLLKKYGKDIE